MCRGSECQSPVEELKAVRTTGAQQSRESVAGDHCQINQQRPCKGSIWILEESLRFLAQTSFS